MRWGIKKKKSAKYSSCSQELNRPLDSLIFVVVCHYYTFQLIAFDGTQREDSRREVFFLS